MKLTVCKKYNRRQHSFLMVLQLEADTMDPYVFVVKDQPQMPSLDTSSSGEIPIGSGGGTGLVDSSSSSSSGSSTSGEGQSSSEPGSDCEPVAVRILVSIASLADIEALSTVSPGDRELYRSNQVALICRSQVHMDLLLEKIVEDLKINAYIQGLENEPFEVYAARDAVVGSNQDQLYHFR